MGLETRIKLDSEAVRHEIMQQEYTLSTLPGTAELHAASWQTNDWLTTDKHGDVVSYERMGAVDPSMLLTEFSLDRYAKWKLYRYEMRAMLLDALSRRARKVVRYSMIADVHGVVIGHRK